jgi:hypothetical protein
MAYIVFGPKPEGQGYFGLQVTESATEARQEFDSKRGAGFARLTARWPNNEATPEVYVNAATVLWIQADYDDQS